MAKEYGYFVNISDGDHGDTEAFIKTALENPHILKWAYILQDKEYYTESDMRALNYGWQYCWADGFEGMEKYSSMEEYIQEKMSQPPFLGDKKKSHWRIVCIVDSDCEMKDIVEGFELQNQFFARHLDGRARIAEGLRSLTHEGTHLFNPVIYADEEVRSDFDFREYIDNTKVNPKWEKFKTMFRPAPRKNSKRMKREYYTCF